MVLVAVPLGLHIFFGVPMCLALQVAAQQAHGTLHYRHGVAVCIAGYGFKLAIHEGGAVIKIHALLLATPLHRGRGAIGRTYISPGAFDVLHTTRAFQ